MKVEFFHAVDEQCIKMWKSFYPHSSEELSELFVSSLREKLAGREINTASLQHFFVVNMHSTPEEALTSLGDVIDDMDFLNAKIKQDEESEKEKEKKSGEEKEEKEGEEEEEEEE